MIPPSLPPGEYCPFHCHQNPRVQCHVGPSTAIPTASPHGKLSSSPHLLQTTGDASGILTQTPRLAAVATPPRAPSQAAPKPPLLPLGHSLVVLPDIWMMHLDSRLISRELKGRTRTATFTEAPAMAPPASCCRGALPGLQREGRNGVRNTGMPTHTVHLCCVNGRPVQGNLPGMLLCLCPKGDVLFHTSFYLFSPSYLRSGPPAQSQGSTGASSAQGWRLQRSSQSPGQHWSLHPPGHPQQRAEPLPASPPPQGAALSPQGANGTEQVPPNLQERSLPVTRACCLLSKPSRAGAGQQDRAGREAGSDGIPLGTEAVAEHAPPIQLPQSRAAASAPAALPGEPVATALSSSSQFTILFPVLLQKN